MSRKKGQGPVVDIESAEDKLGQELIKEIADKEWKTAPLPPEEKIRAEKNKNSKARNNPNSRKNLIQYRKDKPKEVKEEIVKGLKFKSKREEIDPFDYIKISEHYDKDKLISFLPNRRVMKDAEEEIYFYRVLNSFLDDFDFSELSSSDLEDIVSLAINRILEARLLSLSAADPNVLLDISTAIEKFRKHSEKVKGNLSSRRSDRIDVKAKQSFSIVDVLYSYDDLKKQEFEQRMEALEKEREEFLSRKEK